MDDVIVIGGGPAGEAAAYEARARGASVTLIERDLVGGECPFWACMPSKTLLNQAARRHGGLDVPWRHASDRRDWMISREGTPYPSDAGHVRNLEAAGARVIKGGGRLAGRGGRGGWCTFRTARPRRAPNCSLPSAAGAPTCGRSGPRTRGPR